MGILDLFRPKWKNSNASIRIEAVKELTDESILAQLALSDEDSGVRYHAIEKIVDQDVLVKIALEDEDFLDLFIAMGDEDRSVRLLAVQKITDQKTLTQLALSDKNYHVKLLATEKITNQSILTQIALKNEDISFRKVAIKNLENQSILTKIAIEELNEEIALLAAQKINIQFSFSKIALLAESTSAREYAVKNVEDIEVKNKLVLSNINFGLKKMIVENISDTFVLWQIIQTNKPNSPLWDQARLNIKPLLLKKSIDYKRKIPEIIETIKSISNIDELIDIAQNHRYIEARIEAVLRISDQGILTQIAKNEIVYEVRVSAIKKLTNLYTLSEIALTEWDIPMRRQLLQIIFEQLTFLDKIEETEDVNAVIIKGLNITTISPRTKESFLSYLFKSSNPEAFDAIFNWILNTFHPLSQSTIKLFSLHLPEYLNIFVDLRTYEKHVEYRDEGWSSDNGGPWDNEYHSYDKTLMEKATIKLCELKTPVSSNLLHLIANRKSIHVSFGMVCNFKREGALNLNIQKEMALNELKIRGYPNYNSELYLEPNAWQIK